MFERNLANVDIYILRTENKLLSKMWMLQENLTSVANRSLFLLASPAN